MREFDLTATLSEVDWAPANVVVEIMQNVRTIFTTIKHSVPLDRLFGVDAAIVDKPTPAAMARLSAEIVSAIHRYEPRCRVTKVSFDGDTDGRLVPRVKVKIDEEWLVPGVK